MTWEWQIPKIPYDMTLLQICDVLLMHDNSFYFWNSWPDWIWFETWHNTYILHTWVSKNLCIYIAFKRWVKWRMIEWWKNGEKCIISFWMGDFFYKMWDRLKKAFVKVTDILSNMSWKCIIQFHERNKYISFQ